MNVSVNYIGYRGAGKCDSPERLTPKEKKLEKKLLLIRAEFIIEGQGKERGKRQYKPKSVFICSVKSPLKN